MTQAEVRAMTRRCDPAGLRERAGMRQATVAAAFGVSVRQVRRWEKRLAGPVTPAGFAWARFTVALERLEWEAAKGMREAA